MKTRRVLREFKVKDGVFLHEGFGYGNLGGVMAYLPDGTKAELAVYGDVPQKRELVVPEGVKIIEECDPSCMNRTDYIILNNKTVGKYHILTDECWVWQGNESNRVMIRGGYPRFVFETLADLNWYGFSWKTIEPDWSRYDVVTIWYKTNFGWTHYMTSESRMNTMLLDSFKYFKKPDYFAVSLEGRLPDGSVEIIDRWEKDEKGK